MTKIYFSTGEFAKLCGVKKDTLFHYDHIGILKPEHLGENGYRYYSAKQLRTFDMISSLKHLGMSLKEMKDYLDARSPEDFLSLLEKQKEIVKREQERLSAVSHLLEQTLESTKLGSSAQLEEIVLEKQKKSHYLSVPVAAYENFDEGDFLLSTRKLLELVSAHGSYSPLLGDIIRRESLYAGKFTEDFYYCPVPYEKGNKNLKTKPSGTYATMYYKGSYEDLPSAYEDFFRRVEASDFEICGDLYEEDLLQYMAVEKSTDYVMKFSIMVKVNSEK